MQAICDRIWENPACSEFYEILVSCIIDKLYPTSKSEADRFGARALFSQSRHTRNKTRNYGLKALLCTRITFPYTTREPEIN